MYIKRDDEVVVIAGNDKGRRGKVLRVLSAHDKVLVEGVNVRFKHLPKSPQSPQGGRVERSMPVEASNVLLWSEKAGKGVRIKSETRDGKKVRVGIPCGTVFP